MFCCLIRCAFVVSFVYVERNVGIHVPTNDSEFIYTERNVGIHIPTSDTVFIYTEQNVGTYISTIGKTTSIR